MTLPWRVWVLALAVVAAMSTAFGMRPGMYAQMWPIAGLWLTAFVAPFGLSVWAAAVLTALGLAMDLMTEAPVGAWALALLSAYGVGLIAWDRQPPLSVPTVEAITVIGGAVAIYVALTAAGGIAGQTGFSAAALIPDFFITALLYPALRFVFLPVSIREGRR
jgi:hypothetical protein